MPLCSAVSALFLISAQHSLFVVNTGSRLCELCLGYPGVQGDQGDCPPTHTHTLYCLTPPSAPIPVPSTLPLSLHPPSHLCQCPACPTPLLPYPQLFCFLPFTPSTSTPPSSPPQHFHTSLLSTFTPPSSSHPPPPHLPLLHTLHLHTSLFFTPSTSTPPSSTPSHLPPPHLPLLHLYLSPLSTLTFYFKFQGKLNIGLYFCAFLVSVGGLAMSGVSKCAFKC